MIGFKEFINIDENSPYLDEVLSFQARRKKGILMKRRKGILARQRKIALRKSAKTGKLKSRSKISTRDVLTKKYFGGRSKSSMNYAQRARVEKRLKRSGTQMKNISRRLLPGKRRLDITRRTGK